MPKSIRGVTGGALAAALLATAGCASQSTPYQPLSSASRVAGGYADRQLADDRFVVTFAGNELTSRETVESYLLYRAAELTVERGYDWFVIVDREMDHKIEREIRPDLTYDPWFGPAYSHWKPYWRYYDAAHGWREWDPYHGDRFWTHEIDVRTIEQFEATAEVRLGRGARPAGEPNASDARTVMAEIGPRVHRIQDQ